jgi:hypothetical protein
MMHVRSVVERRHFMYWVTAALGAAMCVAPFLLGYRDNSAALWTSLIVGIAVIVLSGLEAIDARKQKWEYWAAGIAGLLAVLAPFVFGFTTVTLAMWTTIGCGLLILLISGYEVFAVESTSQ